MAQLQSTVVTGSLYISGSDPKVGIGTTSPSALLNVGAAGTLHFTESGIGSMLLKGTSSTARGMFEVHNADGASKALLQAYNGGASVGTLSETNLDIITGGSTRMTISGSNGNVGIGTDTPATKFEVRKDNSDTTLTAITSGNDTISLLNETDTTNNYTSIGFVGNAAEITARIASVADASNGRGNLVFLTGDSSTGNPVERMRINSSGDVLVGKTATGLATTGFQAIKSGQSAFVSDGDRSLILNRKTSDGSILEFRKDESTVGSIGTFSSNLYIGTNDSGLRFEYAGTNAIVPFDVDSVAVSDNATDLGSGNARFKDLYLGGDVYLNSGTSYNDKGILYLSNERTAIISDIVNLTANGDTSLDFQTRKGGTRASALFIDEFRNVGIGTTSPNNKLEVEGSSLLKGLVTVTDDIFPEQNYVSNIGSIEKKFLTLHVAELVAETLVASERRATVGGRFNVGIATQLSASLNTSATTIYVKHNNLNNGDIIHLEGDNTGTPKVEFMSVDSGATSVGDGFSYTVTRDLDNSGENEWDAGSGVFNTGQIDSGFIDQYAINSLTTGVSTAGPTIAFMERTGSAYQDIDIRTGVGNLKGWYGYTTDKFGLAAGDYRNNNITVDESNGLRIRSGSSIQLHASSSRLSIGDSFLYDSLNGILYVSGSNIQLVTPSFFLGGENQYISGSGGSIEISGSNFHLLNGNITASNVDLSGKITATSGEIGGFGISADAIFGDNFYLSGSATGNEFFISSSKFNVKANGDVTASNADITGKISATSGEIGGWTINDGDLSSTNITLSSDNESIALGSPTPGNLTSDGIFLSGSGEFNFQVSDTLEHREYIRQSGGVLDIRANKFFIGNETTQFISGANSNIEISSSLFHLDPQNSTLIIGADAVINADVTANSIRTPATIGGAPSTVANASSSIDSNGFAKFVSASIGGWNVDEDSIFSGTKDTSEYSTSGITLSSAGSIHTPNFYVDTGGNAFFKGTLSAPEGNIGGFTLSADAISGDNFYLSGSATGNEFFISSSKFNVKANGDVTGSSVSFVDGNFEGTSEADAFLFNIIKITSANQSTYLKLTDAGYYVLDLSGGSATTAQFVRFEGSIDIADPVIITHIIPPRIGGDTKGFRAVLEGTATGKIKLRRNGGSTDLSSGTLNYDGATSSISDVLDIGHDGDDSFDFTDNSNTEYSIKSGERVDLVKSANDYKIQSTNKIYDFIVNNDLTVGGDILSSAGTVNLLTTVGAGAGFSVGTLDITNISQPTDQTEKSVLVLDGNTVTTTELDVNAYTSAISVGTGLDIANATTAPTISLNLTEVGFTGGSNRLITNDNDGTVTAEANLTFNGNSLLVNGNITGSNFQVGEYISHIGDTNTYIRFQTDDISLSAGGSNLFRVDNTAPLREIVVNESGASTNFRVESDTVTNALVVSGSNGNVGIGTSSPNYELTVRKDSAIPELAIEHFDTPSDNDTIGSILFRGNKLDDWDTASITTAATYAQIRTVITDASDNSAESKLEFRTQNSNTLTTGMSIVGTDVSIVNDLTVGGSISGTVSPSGNLSISGGNVVLDSGQGIDFSATGQASGTAGYTPDNISEVLDDYEEGFWKPIFTSGGIASITNQDIVTGTYVKIGRAVHINAYLRSDGITKNANTTSPVYISNLPFSPDDNEFFSVEVGFVGTWAGDHPDGGYIDGSNSRIALVYRNAANGASTTVNAADLSTGNDANKIMFSATYFTD